MSKTCGALIRFDTERDDITINIPCTAEPHGDDETHQCRGVTTADRQPFVVAWLDRLPIVATEPVAE